MLVLSLMFLKQSYYCQCVKVNEMKTSQSSKALKRKASDNEKNNTPSKRRHNGFKNKKNYKIGKIECVYAKCVVCWVDPTRRTLVN